MQTSLHFLFFSMHFYTVDIVLYASPLFSHQTFSYFSKSANLTHTESLFWSWNYPGLVSFPSFQWELLGYMWCLVERNFWGLERCLLVLHGEDTGNEERKWQRKICENAPTYCGQSCFFKERIQRKPSQEWARDARNGAGRTRALEVNWLPHPCPQLESVTTKTCQRRIYGQKVFVLQRLPSCFPGIINYVLSKQKKNLSEVLIPKFRIILPETLNSFSSDVVATIIFFFVWNISYSQER